MEQHQESVPNQHSEIKHEHFRTFHDEKKMFMEQPSVKITRDVHISGKCPKGSSPSEQRQARPPSQERISIDQLLNTPEEIESNSHKPTPPKNTGNDFSIESLLQ